MMQKRKKYKILEIPHLYWKSTNLKNKEVFMRKDMILKERNFPKTIYFLKKTQAKLRKAEQKVIMEIKECEWQEHDIPR